MFLCFGPSKTRLMMSMQAVYSDDEMFDRASPHLLGTCTHVISRLDGRTNRVIHEPGLTLEFGAGLFAPVQTKEQLEFASKLVVMYHDNLRCESEMLRIDENIQAQEETDLFEAVNAQLLLDEEYHTSSENET